MDLKVGRLSSRELDRYSRQIMIEGIGEEGQMRLRSSTVGVMGVGGLGSPATIYLVAAGVGRVILADYQVPEVSNLNRQIVHWEEDVAERRSKAESAAWKARALNSDVEIEAKKVRVTAENVGEVFAGADIILDCLDDFSPRYLLNEYCVREGIPFIHAAVEGFNGQVTTIVPGVTPCLKCVFPVSPPKKPHFPIVGVAAGLFGVLEAAEAIKLTAGVGEPLLSRLLVGDLLHNHFETIELCREDSCEICSHLPRKK